jgi:uncharacterized membrane protein YfcA
MAFTTQTAILLVLIGFGVGAFGTVVGAGGGFILTRSCFSFTRTNRRKR